MIINNNIPAMNTHRQLGVNQNAMQNSMEKLSSGMRINRAGDDAAGLAISEKMRAQINGLDQASRNAQDGISLIQTAEGALDETHSILQRMRELAVQSANDTNTAEDRAEIQKEVDQLAAEITRVGDNTEFNTQTLLDGNLNNKFHIGANEGQNISVSVADMRSDALAVGTAYTADTTDATTGTLLGEDGETVVGTFQEAVEEVTDGDGNVTTEASLAGYYNGDDELVLASETTIDNGITGAIGIDVSSQEAADGAITTINSAIETVSAQRSELGAVQNRLEHTISNLDNSSENLSAAESRIRDVDMAAEMMEMTRANILSQASQSMLAQANQQPQSVLQLLG
ncbi:flagellin N-terminal helical domain-containing protein [Salisediminibacterium beveridgei]|uniref:Flagellin n=1 Tax=Salisediminibacterium beveridgei TaxID=632773 RepID=A0A1D7QSF4_9BACI|nr:flagellin [Salisediminibacterium beveridgei]AOM81909.1 Flagellin protein FlaA [Salisediminibacterium beveridgei]